jgi:CubicO group peptidase (beta-lactamase class C family)
MKRNTIVRAVVFAVLTSWGALYAENDRENIDRLMKSYYQSGQFNGTILVKKNKDIIYERAFGLADRPWNIENTVDSKFLIGSVSKAYTALMVLILVDEGLIDLNATLNSYIPQYGGPGKNRATIHQMLTHTSGIPNHGAIPDLSKKRVRWIYDSDQYLELVKETSLKFEPGTGFEYSGIAYNLLAIICEKVTHKSFKELLKQKIFLPLGMNDTSLNSNLDIDSKRAAGYEYYLLEGYKLPSYISMDHCKGSGGILSTVIDKALALLSELKKDNEYQINAADYYYLAAELDKKHNLKQESIKIFNEGLRDFPDDFRLSYYYAETLMGLDEKKAIDSYRNCIRLYAGDEKNKRFFEEYQKALKIVNGKADKKDGKNNLAIRLMSVAREAAVSRSAGR